MPKFKRIVSLCLLTVFFAGCQQQPKNEPKTEDSKEASTSEKEAPKEEKEDSPDKGEEKADSVSFDDTVFIGDSVTLKLKLYVIDQRKTDSNYLGKAQFHCAGSLG